MTSISGRPARKIIPNFGIWGRSQGQDPGSGRPSRFPDQCHKLWVQGGNGEDLPTGLWKSHLQNEVGSTKVKKKELRSPFLCHRHTN